MRESIRVGIHNCDDREEHLIFSGEKFCAQELITKFQEFKNAPINGECGQEFKTELENFINRMKNHPSIDWHERIK